MAEEQNNMWSEPEPMRGEIDGVVNPEYYTLQSDQQHVINNRNRHKEGDDERIPSERVRDSLLRDPETPYFKDINDKTLRTMGGSPDKVPNFEPEERYQETPQSPAVRAAKQLESFLRTLLISAETEGRENSKNTINRLVEQVAIYSEIAISLTEEKQREQGEVLGRREFHGLHHLVETWGNLLALRDRLQEVGIQIETADIAHALLALAYHDVDQTVVRIDNIPMDEEALQVFTEKLRATQSLAELNALRAEMNLPGAGSMMRGRQVGAVETRSAEELIEALDESFWTTTADEGERELIRQTLTSAIMATKPAFSVGYIVYQPNLAQPAISQDKKPEHMPIELFETHQRFAERVRALVAFADLATSAMQPELAMQQCVALRIEDSLYFNQLVRLSLGEDQHAELSAERILSNWEHTPELAEAVRQELITWLQQQDGFLEGQRRQITAEAMTVPNLDVEGETKTTAAPIYSLDRLLANLPTSSKSVTVELKAELVTRLQSLQQSYRDLSQSLTGESGWQEELAKRLIAALKPTQPVLAKPQPEN